MILAAMLALALQAAPTVAEMESLTPEAAGRAVLAGKHHRPIARIVTPPFRGMNPPGMVERRLVEQAVASADGCSRRRWTATFFRGPDVDDSQAQLGTISENAEVALPGPAGCPEDGYSLIQNIEPAQAFAALRRLDDLRLRGARAAFRCSDKTGSRLCADPKALRPTLAKLSPWMVTREDGRVVFWMGTPGEVITEVRYNPARPERVAVERYTPAPF